jgi:hypothetical protein
MGGDRLPDQQVSIFLSAKIHLSLQEIAISAISGLNA